MIPHTRTFIRGRHRAAHMTPDASPPSSPPREDSLNNGSYGALPPIDTDVQTFKGGSISSPSEYHSPSSDYHPQYRTEAVLSSNPLANSTSTSGSAPSPPSKRNSQLPFSPINTFGVPFSYHDLPDPSSFGEPTLSFMTTSTGAESSMISTGRNSEIDQGEIGGIGPRVARPRGSAGGSSSGVGSPSIGYGDSVANGVLSKRLSGLTMGKAREGTDARVYLRVMGLPLGGVEVVEREIRERDSALAGVDAENVEDGMDSAGVDDRENAPEHEEPSHARIGSGGSQVGARRTSYISSGSRRNILRPGTSTEDTQWQNHDRSSSCQPGTSEYREEADETSGLRPPMPAQNASYSSNASSDAFGEDLPISSAPVTRPNSHKAMVSSRTVASLRSLHGQRSRSGTVSTMGSMMSGSDDGYGVPLEAGAGYFNRPSPLSRTNSAVSSTKPVNLNSDGESSHGRSTSYSRHISAKTSLSNLPSIDRSPPMPFYHNSAFEFDTPESTSLSEAGEEEEDRPSRAVGLEDDGRSKVVDTERLTMWGGAKGLKSRLQNEIGGAYDGGVLEEFSDVTHITLSTMSDSEDLLGFLEVLLPLVTSTLAVLDISNNMLDRLPPSLARCHAIEEINLSSNPLLVLPTWFGALRNLRVLLVESCGLKALPAELMHASSLHTICARRNRLISLPSWLSQLTRLQTLYVDDNPFSGQWKRLIESILSRPAGGIPVRSDPGTCTILTSSPDSARAWTSSTTPMSPLPNSPFNMSNDGNVSTPLVGNSRSSPLAVTENGRSKGKSPTPSSTSNPGRTIKRMRSAGALLGIGSPSEPPSSASTYTTTTLPRLPRESRHEQTLAYREERGNAVPQMTGPKSRQSSAGDSAQAKPGKWGFLRKMSMNKMRSAGTAPATRPPLPSHTHSDPLQVISLNGPPRPPPKIVAHSAMTLPTMQALRDAPHATEFGSLADHSRQQEGVISIKDKRRSYLTIDQPPKLNIAIPSISPLISTANPFQQQDYPSPLGASSGGRRDPPPQHAFPAAALAPQEHLALPRLSPADRGVGYEVGLKSIMSYLRDLYDLSLPVPVFHGGAEVVHNDATNTSDSQSENRSASPMLSHGRFSAVGSNTTRSTTQSRRPTMDLSSDQQSSIGSSAIPSAQLSGRESIPAEHVDADLPVLKRYKDDSVVRTGVIRHILETERSYVAGLRDLIAIYVKPASAKASSKSAESVIPANEIKIVFGGIEGVYRFHNDSFLPALDSAAKGLLAHGDDAAGDLSKAVARSIGDVFKRYHPFMRQYSAYINNFDFALARLASWTAIGGTGGSIASVATGTSSTSVGVASVAGVAGLGLPSSASGIADVGGAAALTLTQKKRIKAFLKDCRKNPQHAQLNLESYLLLPVQRIPRYRMLLDDLARSTAPIAHVSQDPIEIALQEMEALASLMNEEKRDSESRRRLVQWQARIRGKFATPLVRAHRRLLLDGQLVATRTVRRTANFVEVPRSVLHSGMSSPADFAGRSGLSTPMAEEVDMDSDDDVNDDKEHTITGVTSTALQGNAAKRRKSRPNLSALLMSRPASPADGLSQQLGNHPASSAETTIVQIEALEPEVRNMRLSVILTSDLIVLCRDAAQAGPSHVDSTSRGRSTSGTPSISSNGMNATAAIAGSIRADSGEGGQAGLVDLVAVLKLQTKSRPASVVQGNVIRLVDNRCIWYFAAKSAAEAGRWVRTINDEFEPVR